MSLIAKCYPALRKPLFAMDAEKSHDLLLKTLPLVAKTGLSSEEIKGTPVRLMGLTFPNKVGLAAGLDKDGRAVAGLAGLGFGAVEIGTVTPLPQSGNDKPRLFRLPEHQGIINRMGFNNDGAAALCQRLQGLDLRPVMLGINIGKNKATPNDAALSDYQKAFAQVYPYADYVTINLSSPNTPGLRDLQGEEFLTQLMAALIQQRAELADTHNKHVPIAVKIAPDLSDDALMAMAATLIKADADAVIATNTTIDKNAVSGHVYANEAGGLSGAPLTARATEVIATLAKALDGALPIIGVGGILSGADAQAKIAAGASFVQLYSGLIYRGPGLITEVAEALG